MSEDFALFESMLWEPPSGYFLLDLHLRRLERSAARFGFALDLEALREYLRAREATLPNRPRKIRFELARDGAIVFEQMERKPSTPVRVALAALPVDSGDEYLRHKTSRRGVYERALAARPEADDVLLWNERGELTETCAANLVLELDGERFTPPIDSGLLPGVFRAHLLERGEIREAVLPIDALARATRAFMINSVRRWCELRVQGGASPQTRDSNRNTTMPSGTGS